MYQILIVDDEPNIAEGIKFMVERGCRDCNVVDVAFDGTEGYEKAITLNPDIIITDICMINMNGIEMIQKLKFNKFEGRVIILSGYKDFVYVKNAIALGVEDYLTKPVEEYELYTIIKKVCEEIKMTQQINQKIETLEVDIEKYSKLAKEYTLKEFIDFEGNSLGDLKLNLSKFGFKVDLLQYVCAIVKIGNNSTVSNKSFLTKLKIYIEDYLDYDEKVLLHYSEEQIVIVIGHYCEIDYKKLSGQISNLRLKLEEELLSDISASIGLIHQNLKGIQKSFEEAKFAISYCVARDTKKLIVYDDICNTTKVKTFLNEEEMKSLKKCLNEMDNIACSKIIGEIFEKFVVNENVNISDLRTLSLNLILIGIRNVPATHFQLNEIIGKDILSLESIERFSDDEQLKNVVINVLCSINELILKQGINEEKDVIEEVKEYLVNNFDKKITLADISEKFYINPYYFSQLFKKKNGYTYQSYVTNLRIKRAEKLLMDTNLKIYEICEVIGYTDLNHFNKLFERANGLKPSEYRKNNIENKK